MEELATANVQRMDVASASLSTAQRGHFVTSHPSDVLPCSCTITSGGRWRRARTQGGAHARGQLRRASAPLCRGAAPWRCTAFVRLGCRCGVLWPRPGRHSSVARAESVPLAGRNSDTRLCAVVTSEKSTAEMEASIAGIVRHHGNATTVRELSPTHRVVP